MNMKKKTYNIIRYKNRKLYCYDMKRYITLGMISDFIKEGFDVSIKDYKEKDITKKILQRAILSEESDVPYEKLKLFILNGGFLSDTNNFKATDSK